MRIANRDARRYVKALEEFQGSQPIRPALFRIESPASGVVVYYLNEDDARADDVAINADDVTSGEYVDVDKVEENSSTFLSTAAREALYTKE